MKPVRCGRADARGASATDRDSTKCAGSEPVRQGWRIFFAGTGALEKARAGME